MHVTAGGFCPVSRGADIFAQRWNPVILRELLCGSTRFNQIIRGVPGISRGLLSQRLRAFEAQGIVERRPLSGGRGCVYCLTQQGLELRPVIMALGNWATRWTVPDVLPEEVNTDLLMWDLQRRVPPDAHPSGRVVVEVSFTGLSTKMYWLVLEPGDVSLCLQDSGFDVDLWVTADTLAFHRVWQGYLSLDMALQQGDVKLDGPPQLVRNFFRWLGLNIFAKVKPADSSTPQSGT